MRSKFILNDLSKIQIYCKNHGLQISNHKTVATCISSDTQRRKIKDTFTLTIANIQIKWGESVKSLGVIFDENLCSVTYFELFFYYFCFHYKHFKLQRIQHF